MTNAADANLYPIVPYQQPGYPPALYPGAAYPPIAAERDSELIDVLAIWRAFRRRIRLFTGIALVVAAAVIAVYVLLPRTFSATSQVAVGVPPENVTGAKDLVTPEAPDTYAVDTEVQVVQSRIVARRVVESLKLWADSNFNEAATKAEADPKTRSPNARIARERAVRAATDTVLANLKVARSGLAFVINITFTSPSPTRAAEVANAIADQYLRSQLDTKAGVNTTATAWLEQRLEQLRRQVLAAESRVQRFRAANGLLNTSSFLGGPNASTETMSQQQIGSLNAELATARAALAEQQARAAAARAQLARGNGGEDVGEALNSPVISQLRQQRADVSRQLADLRTRYGSNHPDLLRTSNQLADIDAQIKSEVGRIMSNVDAQVRVAAGRLGSLQGSLSGAEGTLASNSAASVRLSELERNAEAVRTLYQQYLGRYRETSTQRGLERPDSRPVSFAAVPNAPASPKLALFLPLALIAGFGAGAVAVALREMLDRGMHSARDVRDALGLRTLVSIPAFRSTLSKAERRQVRDLEPEFVTERPFSAFTESFRMLRATLKAPARSEPNQIVAITSALPGEGKSTSAICLARVAALDGERAILVECDTRRNSRAASATRGEFGLLEVLAGEIPLDQALQVDTASGAYLLPLSRKQLAPGDVLVSAAMDTLLDTLRTRFDLIVLDTAPILPIAETRLLARKADTAVLLCRWDSTPAAAAAAGANILMESGVKLAGAVLCQVDLNHQKLWDRNDATSYYDSFKAYYG